MLAHGWAGRIDFSERRVSNGRPYWFLTLLFSFHLIHGFQPAPNVEVWLGLVVKNAGNYLYHFFFLGGGVLFWFYQFYTYMIIHSQASRKEGVIKNQFPISQLKHMLWVLIELSQWDGSFEHPTHMFKSVLKHMLWTRLWILKRTVLMRTILLSTKNKC